MPSRAPQEIGRGKQMILRQIQILKWPGSGLGSRLAEFLGKRVLVERSELAFFRVDPPPAPDDAQTGHHGDGEIDAEDPGDLAARENAEQSCQRMQFHADSHDTGRDYVV